MINIYKVYKGIYQRWYQNPHVNDYKKMKEIAHEILEGDKSRKQLLNIAKKLKALIVKNIKSMHKSLSKNN